MPLTFFKQVILYYITYHMISLLSGLKRVCQLLSFLFLFAETTGKNFFFIAAMTIPPSPPPSKIIFSL